MVAAYRLALVDQARRESWTTMHEQLATIIEVLSVLLIEVQAGVPTVRIRKQLRKGKPFRWPRPEWVAERQGASASGDRRPVSSGEIVVSSPRQLVNMLTTGGR